MFCWLGSKEVFMNERDLFLFIGKGGSWKELFFILIWNSVSIKIINNINVIC